MVGLDPMVDPAGPVSLVNPLSNAKILGLPVDRNPDEDGIPASLVFPIILVQNRIKRASHDC